MAIRKYTFNDNSFSKNTLETYYWAGFIAADGCLYIDPLDRKSLEITLHKKDKNHLKKFCKFVSYNGKIEDMKSRDHCRIKLRGIVNILKDLQKFKIGPKKSLTLTFPKIPNKLQKLAFIIGYIDGDGCIYNTKSAIGLTIIGTNDFLNGIKHSLNWGKLYLSNNYWSLTACNKNTNKLLHKLKSIDVPKLSRKWDKVCYVKI